MAETGALPPGLYVVSTPIGAARDITLRALDVLESADAIAAEDTRTARKLMQIHGIALGGRPLLTYHDHNGAAQRPKLLSMLAEGGTLAYLSDAGTPLVADPGYALVRDALEAGHKVHPVPGPSAVLAALVASGMPSDRFLFAGFLPAAAGARRTTLEELRQVPATLVFFETGRRLSSSVREMGIVLGGNRPAAICRELTKRFEETRLGTLADLEAALAAEPAPKGEIVVLVDRDRSVPGSEARDAMLEEALTTMTLKDAVAHVTRELGLPRKDVYRAALALGART